MSKEFHCEKLSPADDGKNLDRKAIGFLLDEASDPIRWRVEREILGRDKPETVQEMDLVRWPQVQKNLGLLTGDVRFNWLHSSMDKALENICGELHDLGIRKGFPALDAKLRPYFDHLDSLSPWGPPFGAFLASLISASATLLGYSDQQLVRRHVSDRLSFLENFKEEFDPESFYVPDPPDMPKTWRGKNQMVNPNCYNPDLGILLPLIHDLISWVEIRDKTVRQKAEQLAGFILSTEYQERIKPGFGTVKAAPRRYYAMGWSVHVPGWKGALSPKDIARLMRLLEIFAHFKAGCASQWFRRSLAWLQRFVEKDGLCWIPKEAFKGGTPSYWVAGGRIALESKPRTYRKRVLEATFRLLLIRKLAEATENA